MVEVVERQSLVGLARQVEVMAGQVQDSRMELVLGHIVVVVVLD